MNENDHAYRAQNNSFIDDLKKFDWIISESHPDPKTHRTSLDQCIMTRQEPVFGYPLMSFSEIKKDTSHLVEEVV